MIERSCELTPTQSQIMTTHNALLGQRLGKGLSRRIMRENNGIIDTGIRCHEELIELSVEANPPAW